MQTVINHRIAETLDRLIAGNQRFVSGLRAVNSIATVGRMSQLARDGQKPSCIVLGCSDSRIPAEILFDQGLGDLFVVRVAGNVVAPSLLASMEFAALNFETPLLVVMGHTKCGAIQAAVDHRGSGTKLLSRNFEDLIHRIIPVVERVASDHGAKSFDINQVAEENVKHSIESIIQESHILRGLVERNKLLIVGAMVDIASGVVKFTVPDALNSDIEASDQVIVPEPGRVARVLNESLR